MNIVSAIVGLSIMGAAAPSVVQMSIAPMQAQKRAENFSIAEASVVTFAATYEGKADADIPDPDIGCVLDRSAKPAYTIMCTHGTGPYLQSVSRSFKGESTVQRRYFDVPINPYGFNGHQCRDIDDWGRSGWGAWNAAFQEWTGPSCIPKPLWTQANFDNSDPIDWVWDINKMNNRGHHDKY